MNFTHLTRKILNSILKFLLAIQGFALLSLLGIEVFFRYVINSALSWPGEVAGFVFVWFTLLGTAYLVGENSHIAFSLISSRVSNPLKNVLYFFSQVSIIFYSYFMIVPGFKYTKLFSFAVSPAAGINMSWLYSAVPVSGVIIILYSTMNIIDLVSKKQNMGNP